MIPDVYYVFVHLLLTAHQDDFKCSKRSWTHVYEK